jgi:isopenicillin N synthase-like dioxygenase
MWRESDRSAGGNPGLPIIDVGGLRAGDDRACARAAAQIGAACRDLGFFYAVGHGVPEASVDRLVGLAREFFAGDLESKLEIDMARGGRAWRGYFPVGRELTSGIPDRKEGLYFGAELGPSHPKVRAGAPLHGANLFPAAVPGLRHAVLDYLARMTDLGHVLARGLSLSLGLDGDHLARNYTSDPRLFGSPGAAEGRNSTSCGEHRLQTPPRSSGRTTEARGQVPSGGSQRLRSRIVPLQSRDVRAG